jgi:hypothetical protein
MEKEYCLFTTVYNTNYTSDVKKMQDDIRKFFFPGGNEAAKFALVYPTHDKKLYLRPLNDSVRKNIVRAASFGIKINENICLTMCDSSQQPIEFVSNFTFLRIASQDYVYAFLKFKSEFGLFQVKTEFLEAFNLVDEEPKAIEAFIFSEFGN